MIPQQSVYLYQSSISMFDFKRNSYEASIVKLPLITKTLAAGKRIVVFYVGELIVGKATKASKKF